MYNDELTASKWALNSAVECHLHTVEVIGSNPIAPTINQLLLGESTFRRRATQPFNQVVSDRGRRNTDDPRQTNPEDQ